MRRDLPKRLHFKDGGYYRVFQNEWTFLGNTRSSALRRHLRLEHGLPADGGMPTWASMSRYLESGFRSAKGRARSRQINFNLTRTEYDRIVARANGFCEVTGIAFDLTPIPGSMRRPWAPSLDRTDAADHYHFANCRLVCCIVNWAMSDWGEDIFWKMVMRARRSKIRGRAGFLIGKEPERAA